MAKQTKREFLKTVGATAGVLGFGDEEDDQGGWIDKDGDGEYMDDIFGEDGPVTADGIPIYVGSAEDREQVNPAEGEVYIALDTEQKFKPTPEGNWEPLKSTGKNPQLESVYADHTQTKSVEYDRSRSYPHWPNQPARSSAPVLKPHPGVDNPIVGPSDVTDINADMVADPFWVHEEETGKVHIFAEAMDRTNDEVIIGRWEANDPTGPFTYQEVTFGIFDISNGSGVSNYSYPWRDPHDGEWYIHDNGGGGNRIQRFNDFPNPAFTEVMAIGEAGASNASDPSIIDWNNRKWLIGHDVAPNPPEKYLYYGQEGVMDISKVEWTAHPSNPIVADSLLGRNGGRPIVDKGGIYIPCRGGTPERVSLIRITDLTATTVDWYEVETSPVIEGRNAGAWVSGAMHHMDPMMADKFGTPAVLVDGQGGPKNDWRLGVYTWATGEDHRLSPRERARTEALVMEPQFESLNGWDPWESDGTITLAKNRVEMATTATQNGFVRMLKGIDSFSYNTPSWDEDMTYRVGIELQNTSSDRREYHGVGEPQNGDAAVSFKIDNGTLQGIVHNGTSETTVNLESIGAQRLRLKLEYFAGSHVDFYVGTPSLTRKGTISTGLPSGDRFKNELNHYLETTIAEARETWVTPPKLVQFTE